VIIATLSLRDDGLISVKIQSPDIQSRYAMRDVESALEAINARADYVTVEQEGLEIRRYRTPVPPEDIEPWL